MAIHTLNQFVNNAGLKVGSPQAFDFEGEANTTAGTLKIQCLLDSSV